MTERHRNAKLKLQAYDAYGQYLTREVTGLFQHIFQAAGYTVSFEVTHPKTPRLHVRYEEPAELKKPVVDIKAKTGELLQASGVVPLSLDGGELRHYLTQKGEQSLKVSTPLRLTEESGVDDFATFDRKRKIDLLLDLTK